MCHEDPYTVCDVWRHICRHLSMALWCHGMVIAHMLFRFVGTCEKKYETNPKTTDDFSRYSLGKTPVMDFYIRFEYLHDDLKTVCQLLDVPYDEQYLPHYKKTRSNEKSYRSFYNEKTKKIIYERHKKEFDQFGYQF